KEAVYERRGAPEGSQAEGGPLVAKPELAAILEATRAEIADVRQQALGESERSSAMLEAVRAELADLRQQALGESERSSAMLEAVRAELADLHSRNIAYLKSIEGPEQQKRDLEAQL